MRSVCVGIQIQSEPHQLSRTLASLRSNTSGYDLLLLPDGPDEATKSALQELGSLTQLATEEPVGASACFNRLALSTDADVVVLLESGSLVGEGWLEHLLAALDADPCNGLAGPSTNLAWNEQCIYPNTGSTQADISRIAQEAFTRYGNKVRSLEPLYSLADFCYAVRRDVIEAVGAADEIYGLGPCWEMDYNIRAARAGFRGVWACAAYVHRLPFTGRRRHEELRRFEASKQRYQDKFCGGRLRREKTDYRPHCRGDECPNFAPPELIRIHESGSGAPDEPKIIASAQQLDQPPLPGAIPNLVCLQLTTVSDPLVSCIMPTFNRRRAVPQAIRCFLRQEYANSELVIVDDGTDPVSDCVPEDSRIRYIRLDRRLTIGAKRNLACSESRGEFIVHWDDDDWYPPSRVKSQVQALLERRADVCGSSRMLFFDQAGDRALEYCYTVQDAPWVGGTTLAYRRSLWERNKFPDIQVGEDSRFVWGSQSDSSICDLADPELCVAMIHPGNTSRKETAGAYWRPEPLERIRKLLADELHFYRSIGEPPLISCIMPTCNRRPFVQLTLSLFRHQDYPNKELVIVDDGDDSVEDLVSNLSFVRYVRLPGRSTIGAKRNLACEHATGEIIAHWDDDDWYSPDRLRYQAAPIIRGEADITGLENAFILELQSGRFWSTQPALHQRMFVGNVHGGTLVFKKQLLTEGLRYPEINLAEDAWLLHRSMLAGKRLLRLSNSGVFIYVRHGANAWREFAPGQFIDPAGWQQINRPAILPAGVLDSYQDAFVASYPNLG